MRAFCLPPLERWPGSPCALRPGRAAGPIAQVPFICNQKPPERHFVGARGPRQPAPAPSARSRSPSPPPQQAAASSSSTCGVEDGIPAADAGPVVRPSRFKDVRLSPSDREPAPPGGDPAAAHPGEAAARSPTVAQVGLEPAAAPPEVVKGSRARTRRAITGPPSGYEPDFFLIGLPEGAGVEVLLVGEGADEGWCWASTSAGESGWLALDALHGM
ncbi:unnamed protein product [Prorocentrum cordatum]|uniref:SH3 domain-containing protein n=1 Tax=Prorocentrum cordatum TaxID=2364126 RepID=A0ABN9QJI5_9DINO|nr:unnamed protein product [Polarella glacialis]